MEAEQEEMQERLEMEHQAELQQTLVRMHFEPRDLDYNITLLTQIAAIIDSLPSWSIHRSEMEQKTYKMAKSMMNSGIAICRRINPDNQMVSYFAGKY